MSRTEKVCQGRRCLYVVLEDEQNPIGVSRRGKPAWQRSVGRGLWPRTLIRVELECADQEVLGGTNFSNKSQTDRKKKKLFNVCGCRTLKDSPLYGSSDSAWKSTCVETQGLESACPNPQKGGSGRVTSESYSPSSTCVPRYTCSVTHTRTQAHFVKSL